jgi:hypothetical protein
VRAIPVGSDPCVRPPAEPFLYDVLGKGSGGPPWPPRRTVMCQRLRPAPLNTDGHKVRPLSPGHFSKCTCRGGACLHLQSRTQGGDKLTACAQTLARLSYWLRPYAIRANGTGNHTFSANCPGERGPSLHDRRCLIEAGPTGQGHPVRQCRSIVRSSNNSRLTQGAAHGGCQPGQ